MKNRMYFFTYLLVCLGTLLAFDEGFASETKPHEPVLESQTVKSPPLEKPLEKQTEAEILNAKLQHFMDEGVPPAALARIFDFLESNKDQQIPVQLNQGNFGKFKINNKRFIGIADFTLPSDEKRFYLMDLETGLIEKHFISHGVGTGFRWAHDFSNEYDSRKTSLGIFLTGNTYQSGAFLGTALKIFGLEKTNDNAFGRLIVMHPASYASPQFTENLQNYYLKNGKPSLPPRMGRSFGCFALDPAEADQIIAKLKNGALILAYADVDENDLHYRKVVRAKVKVSAEEDIGITMPIELAQREPRLLQPLPVEIRKSPTTLNPITRTESSFIKTKNKKLASKNAKLTNPQTLKPKEKK